MPAVVPEGGPGRIAPFLLDHVQEVGRRLEPRVLLPTLLVLRGLAVRVVTFFFFKKRYFKLKSLIKVLN